MTVNILEIPDLEFWYSAEAEEGYADNADIPELVDQSGNLNDTTGVFGGAIRWRSNVVDRPAIEFHTGSGHFTLPDMMAGAASGEIFAWVRSQGPTGPNAFWRFGSSGAENWYPFNDNRIYDDFGSTVRYGPIVHGSDTTNWHRLNVWSANNDWGMRLDGVSIRAEPVNTVGWGANPRLGIVGSAGASPGLWLSSVVGFRRKLTAGERADVDDWQLANIGGGVPETVFPVTAGKSIADLIRLNLGAGVSNKSTNQILIEFWSATSGLAPVGSYSLADHKKAALAAIGAGSITDRFIAWLDTQGLTGTGTSVSDKEFDYLGGI